MRYLVYNEPSEHGDVEVRRTYEEAIQYQRTYLKNKTGFDYQTDELALADYIALNWAYCREEL